MSEKMFKLPTKPILYAASTESFQLLLASYIVLVAFDTIRPESVSGFFNLNLLLIVVLLLGIVSVLCNEGKPQHTTVQRAARAVIVQAIRLHKRQQAQLAETRQKIIDERRVAASRHRYPANAGVKKGRRTRRSIDGIM